jgi:hypothetical protein
MVLVFVISIEGLEGHMQKLYQLREVGFCNRKFSIISILA